MGSDFSRMQNEWLWYTIEMHRELDQYFPSEISTIVAEYTADACIDDPDFYDKWQQIRESVIG